MSLEVSPDQWADSVLLPRFERFEAAVGRLDSDGNRVLTDCFGSSLGHSFHDALLDADVRGQSFSPETLRRIAGQFYSACQLSTSNRLRISQPALEHWRGIALERLGQAQWNDAGNLVVGLINYTSFAHAGPGFRQTDWAVVEVIKPEPRLTVKVYEGDGKLAALRADGDFIEFRVDLQRTLQAQAGEDGLKSVVSGLLAKGERVLSGLRKLGIEDGQLYELGEANPGA